MHTRTFYISMGTFGRDPTIYKQKTAKRGKGQPDTKICLLAKKEHTQIDIRLFQYDRNGQNEKVLLPYFALEVATLEKAYFVENIDGELVRYRSLDEVIRHFWPGSSRIIPRLILRKLEEKLSEEGVHLELVFS